MDFLCFNIIIIEEREHSLLMPHTRMAKAINIQRLPRASQLATGSFDVTYSLALSACFSFFLFASLGDRTLLSLSQLRIPCFNHVLPSFPTSQ